jgi:hypothetical protein
MIALFILIYLMSFIIHLIVCYKEGKRHIFYMRDLIEEIEFYMWCPVLNTLMLITYALCVCVIAICKLFKLDILWERFKSIKLK